MTSYAETISIYGTEQVFVDGDDTPFSKAILTAAYASRGLKMRVTSGGGAEVLMGAAEKCSILYLESRCVSLARALGSQGVQNGGIDGVGVVASVPEGMKELLAENLMVMMRDLESCAGNDNLISESDIRRSAHTLPVLLAGADFIFSGFGSIPRYDNAFALSNFNADDRRLPGSAAGLGRRRRAAHRVTRASGAGAQAGGDGGAGRVPRSGHRRLRRHANRRRGGGQRLADLPTGDPKAVAEAATAIEARQLTVFDVVAALHRTGYAPEARRSCG